MAEKSPDTSPSEEASASQNEDRPSGNWWDSWITTAKTKSAEVYTMVKKDLDEIGSAVKSEATHVFSTTSNVIGKTLKLDVPESPANIMKKSFSSFIGHMSTVLDPEPEDDDDTEVILSSGDTMTWSTYKKELEALQRVDATFLVPVDSPEFDAWLESIEPSSAGILPPHRSVRKLEANPVLEAQYKKLVPEVLSYKDFWERYLFRVALLQDRLAAASRKQPVEETTSDPVVAHLPLQTTIEQSPKKVLSGIEDEKTLETTDVDNVVSWDHEDFANEVELTEEQQILLLEEYEREIATKKQIKQKPAKDVANNNTVRVVDNRNAQTTDKMNNKAVDKNTSGRSPKNGGKTDVCGNNLVEDYFDDKEVKDDASANSDESWEKDFEVDDVVLKA